MPAVTRSVHQPHHTTNILTVIFQGTKGYVGPKGDEGEAGDPGNDVSNLYKAA